MWTHWAETGRRGALSPPVLGALTQTQSLVPWPAHVQPHPWLLGGHKQVSTSLDLSFLVCERVPPHKVCGEDSMDVSTTVPVTWEMIELGGDNDHSSSLPSPKGARRSRHLRDSSSANPEVGL